MKLQVSPPAWVPSFLRRAPRGRLDAAVGLDLGESALKAVEVQRTAAGAEVLRAATAPIPADVRAGGPAALGEWLADALRRHGFRARRAVWVVPRHQVILRWLQLPAGTPDEITRMVRFQAGKDLPLPVEQVRFNFVCLGEEPFDSAQGKPSDAAQGKPTGDDASVGRRVHVLLAAVPAAAADRLMAIADAAGLDLAGAVPSTVATWIAAAGGASPAETAARQPSEAAGVAVMDIGWGSTEVLVGCGGRIRFSRSAPVGLSGLAGALGVGGLPAEAGAPEGEPAPPPPDAAAVPFRDAVSLPAAAGAWAQKFLSEVSRSIRAQQSEPGGIAVGRILVAGGGARISGLVKAVEEQTGIPAAPLDLSAYGLPASGAAAAPLDPSFAAALGAALGNMREDVPSLDLLGALESRRRLVLGRLQRAGIAAAALFLAAFGVGRYVLAGKEDLLADREARLAQLRPRVEHVLKIEKAVDLASHWGPARASLADLLLEITTLRPSDVYVTQLAVEDTGAIRIQGRCKSNQAISRFVNGLKGSKVFSSASLGPLTRNSEKGEYRFDYSIAVQIRAGEGAARVAKKTKEKI